MLNQTLLWLGAVLLPIIALAEPAKYPKNITQAYHLMISSVAEYGERSHVLLPYSDPLYGQYFEWVDFGTSIYGLPVIDDQWYDEGNAGASGTKGQMGAMLSCVIIGQPTLTYLRTRFSKTDTESLSGTEKHQMSLFKNLGGVPDDAYVAQVCQLFFGFNVNDSAAWEYENLLSTIGDDFRAIENGDPMSDRPNHSHYFNGSGDLHLNGAIVSAFKAMVNEKATSKEHVPMWMLSVSYRLSPPPSS